MRNILVIGFLILFATGCIDLLLEQTVSEKLAKTYKVSEVQIAGIKDASTDYSAYRYTFNIDKTYLFKTANGQSSQGTWALNPTDTKITLDPNLATKQEVSIIEISDSKLDLEFIIPKTFKDPEKKMLVKLLPL